MKTYLDCLPCFLQQTLRAGRVATDDEKILKQLLDDVGMMLKDIPLENTPPETGMLIYQKISQITGNKDPYKKIKRTNVEKALLLYPELKEKVSNSEDRLLVAIRFAITGNVIDLGVNKEFDIVNEIKKILTQDFAVFDYSKFKTALNNAENILYIGDNAGEAVFDKILIEELNKPVTYVVREIPVINDVTKEEARFIGIDKVAKIVSSGTTAPGTILDLCNEKFIDIFNNADLIISKGQGNYEGLSGVDRSLFFLLKVKCKIIATNIGVQEDDIILKGINL
ncbi:MAG: DUF89 family protein [Candidatus Marinimicrobia bacterium]|nr:DUF89 family protein [Candidatus Neomarinimicrobiota bacterium]